MSSIGCFNYNLSKFLGKIIAPCINNSYSPKDSFTFVEELKKVRESNLFMVSFDVESLFTNIPLKETINIAVEAIISRNPDIKISRLNLTRLFEFCTSNTHFLFKGEYYEQIDGVAMGSPLAPLLANLFMGHHEENWLKKLQYQYSTFFL